MTLPKPPGKRLPVCCWPGPCVSRTLGPNPRPPWAVGALPPFSGGRWTRRCPKREPPLLLPPRGVHPTPVRGSGLGRRTWEGLSLPSQTAGVGAGGPRWPQSRVWGPRRTGRPSAAPCPRRVSVEAAREVCGPGPGWQDVAAAVRDQDGGGKPRRHALQRGCTQRAGGGRACTFKGRIEPKEGPLQPEAGGHLRSGTAWLAAPGQSQGPVCPGGCWGGTGGSCPGGLEEGRMTGGDPWGWDVFSAKNPADASSKGPGGLTTCRTAKQACGPERTGRNRTGSPRSRTLTPSSPSPAASAVPLLSPPREGRVLLATCRSPSETPKR